jgi:hypothetical protein
MHAAIHHRIVYRPDLAGLVAAPAAASQDPRDHPANPSMPGAPFPADGPALWAGLHLMALLVDKPGTAHQKHARRDLLPYLRTGFAESLPCGACRQDWLRMLADTPPDFGKFFEWTVNRHNEVNLRLGKPVISVKQARDRWKLPKTRKSQKKA